MELSSIRDLLNQLQANARVSIAIGDPVPVGDRVIIPVAEVAYGGGGGGGGGGRPEHGAGNGGGGGLGVHARPLGCWVIGPDSERWLPAFDVNRCMLVAGTVAVTALLTLRALVRRR